MNCGGGKGGSCHGGSHSGAYEFIKESGYVPYESCMPYIACSDESTEGFCKQVDTTCKPINICRTCNTFTSKNGTCVGLNTFPNATGMFILRFKPCNFYYIVLLSIFTHSHYSQFMFS